jgi:hypothetical protein
MNIDEAKTKWCPFITYTIDNEGSFYTTNDKSTTGFETCIADECMCWIVDIEQYGAHTKEQGHCGLTK